MPATANTLTAGDDRAAETAPFIGCDQSACAGGHVDGAQGEVGAADDRDVVRDRGGGVGGARLLALPRELQVGHVDAVQVWRRTDRGAADDDAVGVRGRVR